MTFFRTPPRDLFAAFFSLGATLLHMTCCLLPLYASFAAAFGSSILWKAAQPYLWAAQVWMLLYCIGRILASRQKLFRVRVYMISALITLPGIGLGLRDTFRSREQDQAIRILDNLRYQESVTLSFLREPELPRVKQVLAGLKGVRWEKTEWGAHGLTVHYHSGMISEAQVLQALVQGGYEVEIIFP